ncbi:hypothetical protein YC2023_010907 [Brassica napus]
MDREVLKYEVVEELIDGNQEGREASTTGSKHDGKTRNWAKTLISVLGNFLGKPEAREIFFIKKYSGRTEIRPMNREARGGSLHGFRTWFQSSNKMSVSRSSRCHRAWKLYMQPDM